MAVPVMIYLILNGSYFGAFWLFVAAGVSDAIDGYIAKQLGQATILGSYLDPLADKSLLVGVYITLGHENLLPSWLVILVVFRVLIIIGGVFVLEAISVIAQVISFKLTGKRIFKMAPIHHHFEKKGWPESTVVIRFWIISIILAMIGLATLKLR